MKRIDRLLWRWAPNRRTAAMVWTYVIPMIIALALLFTITWLTVGNVPWLGFATIPFTSMWGWAWSDVVRRSFNRHIDESFRKVLDEYQPWARRFKERLWPN